MGNTAVIVSANESLLEKTTNLIKSQGFKCRKTNIGNLCTKKDHDANRILKEIKAVIL